jgi:hypothetical protein
VEIFFWILLTPSAIFTTQAAAPGHPAVASLGAWCLVFAAMLFLWGTCWVIVWKILICKTIVFVVIPRRSRVSFFGTASKPSFVAPGIRVQADHPFPGSGRLQTYSQVGARQRLSRAGFVADADYSASMPAGWCALPPCASTHILVVSPTLSIQHRKLNLRMWSIRTRHNPIVQLHALDNIPHTLAVYALIVLSCIPASAWFFWQHILHQAQLGFVRLSGSFVSSGTGIVKFLELLWNAFVHHDTVSYARSSTA